MTMKLSEKSWIFRAAAGILLVCLLAGCGDGSDEGQSETIITLEELAVTNPSVYAEPETVSAEAAFLCSSKLTPENAEAVQEIMKELQQNLELPEYVGEGIHMVSSDVFLETISQDLYEGCRSYTLREEDSILLTLQVGYDIDGMPYINICYQGKDDSVLVLKQAKGVTWLLQTGVSNGAYDGGFEIWQIDSAAGQIRREQGTYSEGIPVGDFTTSEYTGAPGEAFDFWNNRENFPYEISTVTYDDQGTIVATPTPEPTPEPTAKPQPVTTPKPTTAPTPQPTPEPQPEPQPQPTPEPQPQPTPEPQPEPQPQPTPEPTPAPTPEPAPTPSTGDTDVEWSEDLM